jgi:hypothetical protein
VVEFLSESPWFGDERGALRLTAKRQRTRKGKHKLFMLTCRRSHDRFGGIFGGWIQKTVDNLSTGNDDSSSTSRARRYGGMRANGRMSC